MFKRKNVRITKLNDVELISVSFFTKPVPFYKIVAIITTFSQRYPHIILHRVKYNPANIIK